MRKTSWRLLPSGSLLSFGFVSAGLMAFWPDAAPAQETSPRTEAIAESVLRPWSLRQARNTPDPRTADEAPADAPAEIDDGRTPRDFSMMSGAVQVVQEPRDPVTGAYRRPKIIVGLPSDAMKSWLKSNGIVAERCMLPMVRARAKLSEEGEASGALWLYARCTFQ